ncbi:MAG: AbiJ-NTD4 domain-containing protein [Acidithiobacillus sp.]
MVLFSQRKGIRPIQKAIQREAMDDELRNRLWNALKLEVLDHWVPSDIIGFQREGGQIVERLVEAIWLYYFKQPLDIIPPFNSGHPKSAYQLLRDYFFSATWWEVYDFLEFIVKALRGGWGDGLCEKVNEFLEAENAAYRFVQDEIVEITDQNEIEAIESAIETGVSSTRIHFERALELLSDRSQPDYRNSIKESISSVEAMCQTLTGSPKATLSECLKMLKLTSPLHPAFEQALNKLYGYSSDGGGIRHSITDDSEYPTYADAKFMLVVCSGFVNYLWTKAAESGIKVNKS